MKIKQLIWVVLILALITSLYGCARARRIANDVDWIVFDGQPSREN